MERCGSVNKTVLKTLKNSITISRYWTKVCSAPVLCICQMLASAFAQLNHVNDKSMRDLLSS